MSDPTPPTALPARPAARRSTANRAQRLAAQAAATEGAADAARRVIDASFGVVPGADDSATRDGQIPTQLSVYVSCDVDGPRPAAGTQPLHGIDIAVTVRVADPATRVRSRLPRAEAA